MIEDELHQTFLRAEKLVPQALPLVAGIDTVARRRRSRRRIWQATAAAVAVLVGVAIPVLWTRGQVDHADSLQPAASGAPAGAGGGMNVLIAGLDGAAGSPARHTDTLIVAHVSADGNGAYLVSIPRDLFVDIPGHGRGKINTAYALGGGPLMTQTVSNLTGLRFNAAAVVEYAGLKAVVDGLGGVSLCVDEPTTSVHTKKAYVPGCYQFTGDDAMDYLRQRMSLPGGALDRDRHALQFAMALARKAVSVNTLLDPSKVQALLTMAGHGVTVDAGGSDVIKLLISLRPALDHLVALSVPTVADREGAEVGWRLEPGATDLFAAFRDDTVSSWVAANPKAVLNVT